jgi:hypothetical protein
VIDEGAIIVGWHHNLMYAFEEILSCEWDAKHPLRRGRDSITTPTGILEIRLGWVDLPERIRPLD